jgi:magnesium transporter
MGTSHTLQQLREHQNLLLSDNAFGKALWKKFLTLHPADIAKFLTDLSQKRSTELFAQLPHVIQAKVFEEFSDMMKLRSLPHMSYKDQVDILNVLPVNEVADLFDMLTDDELRSYLKYLHTHPRERVISLMEFNPDSAGGVMDIDVFTLPEDFTVEKSITLLQRLQLSKDVYQRIYVVNKEHALVGYINLEDLVLQRPHTLISAIMKPSEYVAQAHEDKEKIAKKMVHYGIMNLPVVGEEGHFLGAIPAETLVDVLVDEASEDLQKMFALAPTRGTYFETSFIQILFERSYILIGLLIAQSFSTTIMDSYKDSLGAVMLVFITMLIGAGGNASNQTSAVVIQGLATGEIRSSNVWRFLRREFLMAGFLAGILSCVGYIRANIATGNPDQSWAIAVSLFIIVFVGVILGSVMPLVLKRMKIDPAFSAGPFLGTLMDILGSFIFCSVSYLVLHYL